MNHRDIFHTRCFDENYLAAGREYLRVLHAGEGFGGDASAVEDYLGTRSVRCLDVWKFLSDELHAEGLEMVVQVFYMLGRVNTEGCEGDSEAETLGELRDYAELEWLASFYETDRGTNIFEIV